MAAFLQVFFFFFALLSLFTANSFINTEQEKNYQHLWLSMKHLSRLESIELLQYKLSQIWRKKVNIRKNLI